MSENGSALQEALDVWSLGDIAFELLSGQPALRMTEGKDEVRTEFRLHSCITTACNSQQQMTRSSGTAERTYHRKAAHLCTMKHTLMCGVVRGCR
jgi:hypothetical protein